MGGKYKDAFRSESRRVPEAGDSAGTKSRIVDPSLASVNEIRFAKFVNRLKPIARKMQVVGVVMDGISLHLEINKSLLSGDWHNTGSEASRIAGGWSGAYALGVGMGSAFATVGMMLGGPIGGGIGLLAGGFLGSTIGYLGGGTIGESLFNYFTK